MNIQLYCNSSCQSSRSMEAAAKYKWPEPYITINYIPDEDLDLSCDEFKSKYNTNKFPFAIVDGSIVQHKDLHKLILHDLYEFSTGKKVITTIHT